MSEWLKRFVQLASTPWLPIVGAVVLFIAGLGATALEEQLYRTQEGDDLTVQAQILATNMGAALVFMDEEAAQENVNALQASPELEAAGVYNAEGRLFAGFVRMGAERLPQRAETHGATVAGNALSVALPIIVDQNPVGTVYLRATLQPVGLRLARYGGIFLLLTMAGLVLAVSFAGHRGLRRANAQLAMQAGDLVLSNLKLQNEMTERAKAEEALRQSQKMEAIGQLSGGIAHDFNNLITIIQGNLRFAKRRVAQGRTDVESYLEAATDALRRAAVVTQRILAFSRQQPLSPRPIDLNQLLNGINDLLRHAVGDRVHVEWQLDADWRIFCDDQQMETVILNLANNARDAMPDGGTVRFETANVSLGAWEGHLAGEYVRLTIRDNGMGMSDEVRRKAIDPFFTTKPPGRGTGLGLSMAFGFAQQSGGDLQIESELGRGTAVKILLPRYVIQSMEMAT